MGIDIIFKIAGIGIITAVLNNILEKSDKKEMFVHSPQILLLQIYDHMPLISSFYVTSIIAYVTSQLKKHFLRVQFYITYITQ